MNKTRISFVGDTLDGMKNSPANGPGTPREEGPSMGDYGIPGYGQENVGSILIVKNEIVIF